MLYILFLFKDVIYPNNNKNGLNMEKRDVPFACIERDRDACVDNYT